MSAANPAPSLRVVLDTNVIISAFCFPHGIPRKIFQAVGEHHVLLISEAHMAELEEVLMRDKFDRFLPRNLRQQALQSLDIIVTYINVTSVLDDIADTPDNEILALAVDGNTDYLVTGNTKHFMSEHLHRKYGQFTICTPREFYEAVLSNTDG